MRYVFLGVPDPNGNNENDAAERLQPDRVETDDMACTGYFGKVASSYFLYTWSDVECNPAHVHLNYKVFFFFFF